MLSRPRPPRSPHLLALLGSLAGALAVFALVVMPALVCIGLALVFGVIAPGETRVAVAAALVAGCLVACIAVARGTFEPR